MDDKLKNNPSKNINIDEFDFEIVSSSETSEQIQLINELLNKNGISVTLSDHGAKSMLRLSIYQDKLRRNAGRKKSPEKAERLDEFRILYGEGLDRKHIMEKLSIGQASYYRYKKIVDSEDS